MKNPLVHCRLLVVILLVAGGCGGSGIDVDLIAVEGIVKYDDGSFPQGEIRWIRLEPIKKDEIQKIRKAASATISKEDGRFEMYTVRPGDGVIPGKYKVVFLIRKSNDEPVSLVAEQFTTAGTTPFEIDVPADLDRKELEYVITRP